MKVFSRINLTVKDLKGTILTVANLSGTTFTFADLTSSILDDSDLCEVDLSCTGFFRPVSSSPVLKSLI